MRPKGGMGASPMGWQHIVGSKSRLEPIWRSALQGRFRFFDRPLQGADRWRGLPGVFDPGLPSATPPGSFRSAHGSPGREGGAPSPPARMRRGTVPWATSWLPVSGSRREGDACVGADLRIGPRKPRPNGSGDTGLETGATPGPRLRGDDKASPYWDRTDLVRARKSADSDPRTLNRPPPRLSSLVSESVCLGQLRLPVSDGDSEIGPTRATRLRGDDKASPYWDRTDLVRARKSADSDPRTLNRPPPRLSSLVSESVCLGQLRLPVSDGRFGDRPYKSHALARRRRSVALLGSHGLGPCEEKRGFCSAHPKPLAPYSRAPTLPTILIAMNVGNVQMSEAALRMLQAVDSKPQALQMNMLKKAMNSQQDAATELLKMLEGKGQNLDIRV
jgi:hypothetical protein